MRNLIKNKRGDIPSLLISLVVILFAVGIASMLFSKVFLDVTAEIKSQPGFSNNTINTIEKVEGKTIPLLDYLFFFSFIGIFIGLIISSIYIDVHPALMIIFFIVLIITVVLAGIFANAFTEIGEQTELLSTYNQFRLTKMIMNHFGLIVFAVGILTIIVLYGKTKGGGMGGMP